MNILKRLEKLREYMKRNNIEGCIIPTSDPHQSEYVSEHFMSRKYITGFTGSAGTAVITMDKAGLWTDGRYYVQAGNELDGSTIELFKETEKETPLYYNWFLDNVSKGSTIAFDGRLVSNITYNKIKREMDKKNISIKIDEDFINEIWEDRPGLPDGPAFIFEEIYSGESTKSKISRVRKEMNVSNGDYYVISKLDDIAWLYNIRGNDIECNPLVISYGVLTLNDAFLFVNKEKIPASVAKSLAESGVTVLDYSSVFTYLGDLKTGITLFDSNSTSAAIVNSIGNEKKEIDNIIEKLKSIKNEVELANIRKAMIRDGVAMVRFLCWLEKEADIEGETEYSVSQKLNNLREAGENFIDFSFGTISAYGENAAMPHYSASEENSKRLERKGLYLVDSGAQYLDGTTDITRTIALGEISKEEKRDFTLVLKGMINLSTTIYPYGTTGSALDAIARVALWKEGMNFNHGTGHGVGFCLGVHEGPQRISPLYNEIALESGMLTSNEPGVYKPGRHGIRIENLVVTFEKMENEFGKFMGFETVTLCPIDLKAIEKDLLTNEEVEWLNDYHKNVNQKLSKYLNSKEQEYLNEATRSI